MKNTNKNKLFNKNKEAKSLNVPKLFVCGRNSVLEAYKNGFKFSLILVADPMHLKLFQGNSKTKVQLVSKDEIKQITNENHQGFIGFIESWNYLNVDHLIKNQPKLVLALDKVQDPHNLGAIIRTANAAGVKDIILTKSQSAEISTTVLKIASGGFIGVNFYRVNSLSATLTKLKDHNYWVYATTLDEKALPHTIVQYNTPSVLVVGNEGEGVSKSVLSVTDQTVYIKQTGTVQSLNVSVATGIVLFDAINKLD
ncbi:23S rRNA (guanosine(2251)-2'-O)-methyltransferase RlmB [Mycoplasma nasistruthionis]|uniref:23S rRNA (guanosine(2251)-2'-O)-methyltransferase RlmB n=1 Tax=Mycoplasma nasistruthionis TaxID=353852 RepID=UPI0021CAFBCA|nr:23S rRNA (guanosine(2251)-2'-O)-methyltransferase RlmB [Mycoplasma nasistruthionis]